MSSTETSTNDIPTLSTLDNNLGVVGERNSVSSESKLFSFLVIPLGQILHSPLQVALIEIRTPGRFGVDCSRIETHRPMAAFVCGCFVNCLKLHLISHVSPCHSNHKCTENLSYLHAKASLGYPRPQHSKTRTSSSCLPDQHLQGKSVPRSFTLICVSPFH